MIRALLFILPLIFVVAAPVRAQDSLRIAAVVNDQVISIYDLNMRLSLSIAFSGLPDTADTHRRLGPQVLRTLIDEELMRQEGKRLKITVSEKEIADTIRRVEKSNNVKEGNLDSFLARRNIEKTALTKQIEAQIYWGKLVGSTFGPLIQISDEEVNAALAEVAQKTGKPEYRVSEIYLPVDKPERDAEVLALANRLIQQVGQGVGFDALARNFSKSATADNGGDLGWNVQGQLGRALDGAISGLQPGQISAPIRTADGYYILRVGDVRTAGAVVDGASQSPIVNVQQFFLPVEKGASPAEVATVMDAAKRVVARAKTCEELDKAGKEIGSQMSGNLGDIRIDALGPQQRSLVRTLPPLTPSQPLRTEDGVIVLMVCKREDPKAPENDQGRLRDRVENRLVEERLGLAANQYMKDLKRRAFVDIRI